MYTSIYQNSYVVFAITFILLSVLFYLFEIGYSREIVNGKVVKKFSWKYPLAIALIVWLIWYFYLYPPAKTAASKKPKVPLDNDTSPYVPMMTKSNKLTAQKIILANWN